MGIPTVPFPPYLSLPFTRMISPQFRHRRRAAPPHSPSSPALLPRSHRAHRARLSPRNTPVPSPLFPVLHSAAEQARREAGHGAAAASPAATRTRPVPAAVQGGPQSSAPTRPVHHGPGPRHTRAPRSTMDRWTTAPRALHSPSWTGPLPSRRVASRAGHPVLHLALLQKGRRPL